MSNPNNQNIPEPSDKHIDKSAEKSSLQSNGQSLHNLFLQDISSEKHIPGLKQNESSTNRITLIEAIFNATITRAFKDTIKEFRLLGANLVDRSVLFGLSKEFGQSPLFALLKGEIKEGQPNKIKLDSILDRIAQAQKEKKLKDKGLETPQDAKMKDKVAKGKENVDIKKDGLESQEGHLDEEKAKSEINSKQDIENQLQNKQYNISQTINKATELELSMLKPAEHHKNISQKLEHSMSADLGNKKQSEAMPTLSIERLKHCIKQFSHGKILVSGDLLIDELLEGRPERISREAPVLILEHVDTTLIPGGAANTAHNVTTLGGQCHAIGICGKDEYANKLVQLLDKHGISHSLICDPERPTTVKTRILSKTHALMQQLLRLDRISHAHINSQTEASLIASLESVSKQYPILILSDYRGGVVTNEVIHACKRIAASQDLMLIVDAQNQFERFQNVTLLTPNQTDTEEAVGYKINSQSDILQAGQDMLLLTGAQSVLITLGKEGMALFTRGNAPFSLPAFNRSEVYDVSGAGDTVVATIALALATGATLPEAIALGNIAAGIVVTKPGTAVTSQNEMLNLLPLIKLPT